LKGFQLEEGINFFNCGNSFKNVANLQL